MRCPARWSASNKARPAGDGGPRHDPVHHRQRHAPGRFLAARRRRSGGRGAADTRSAPPPAPPRFDPAAPLLPPPTHPSQLCPALPINQKINPAPELAPPPLPSRRTAFTRLRRARAARRPICHSKSLPRRRRRRASVARRARGLADRGVHVLRGDDGGLGGHRHHLRLLPHHLGPSPAARDRARAGP